MTATNDLTITRWPRTEAHEGCPKNGFWRFLHGTFYKASFQCDGCHEKKEATR